MDAAGCLRGGLRVQGGQLLGCGQAHLVADPVIAGDGTERLGGGSRVVCGELLGCGHAAFIAVVVHGLVAFCAGGSLSGVPLAGFTRRL